MDWELVAAYKEATSECMARPGVVGWMCTTVMFPQHWNNFVKAGWIPEPHKHRADLDTRVPLTLWTALPKPQSTNAELFWEVSLDPLLTNVLILKDYEMTIRPPNFQIQAGVEQTSTFLLWPWLHSLKQQSEWLSKNEVSLVLFAMGITKCAIGVQFITQASGMNVLCPSANSLRGS